MRVALLALAACRFGFDPIAGGDGGANDSADSGGADRSTISAGMDHTCLIRGTQLYCFGTNGGGQLGVGDIMQRDLPVHVPGDWRDVIAGGAHTCAVDTGGQLHCWGGNTHGELGVGDFAIRMTPAPVTLPLPVRIIDATDSHTCAILEDGSLWAWGENSEGQLGQNDGTSAPDHPLPVRMSPEFSWTAVGCGYAHTVAAQLSAGGTGRNTSFQLGLGNGAATQYRVLTAITSVSGPWSMLSAGQNGSCGIRNEDLWCWGDNASMELGTGDSTSHDTPFLIDTMNAWVDVELDTFGGCGLTAAGEAFCWGRNVEGQLGVGDQVDRLVPTRTGGTWKTITAGRFHTCGEDRDGGFYCAGKGSLGALGIGPAGNTPSFTPVMLPAN